MFEIIRPSSIWAYGKSGFELKSFISSVTTEIHPCANRVRLFFIFGIQSYLTREGVLLTSTKRNVIDTASDDVLIFISN